LSSKIEFNAFPSGQPQHNKLKCDSDLTHQFFKTHETELDDNARLDEKLCLIKVPENPESSMTTNLDCGTDPLRIAMCREPLELIEKALAYYGHDWAHDFSGSSPYNLSNSTSKFGPTFDCDLTMTKIIAEKSNMEYDQKICLFSSMKKIANNLDCGNDGLHVLMCREPFLLFEKALLYHGFDWEIRNFKSDIPTTSFLDKSKSYPFNHSNGAIENLKINITALLLSLLLQLIL